MTLNGQVCPNWDFGGMNPKTETFFVTAHLVDFISFTPDGVFNVHGGVVIEDFFKNLCALMQAR